MRRMVETCTSIVAAADQGKARQLFLSFFRGSAQGTEQQLVENAIDQWYDLLEDDYKGRMSASSGGKQPVAASFQKDGSSSSSSKSKRDGPNSEQVGKRARSSSSSSSSKRDGSEEAGSSSNGISNGSSSSNGQSSSCGKPAQKPAHIVPPSSMSKEQIMGMIAYAPPGKAKQIIGERHYALIQKEHPGKITWMKEQPPLAGKIMGMLLEGLHNTELVALIDDHAALHSKIAEAMAVIEAHRLRSLDGAADAAHTTGNTSISSAVMPAPSHAESSFASDARAPQGLQL